MRVVVVVVCALSMSSEQCLHSNYTVISTFAQTHKIKCKENIQEN